MMTIHVRLHCEDEQIYKIVKFDPSIGWDPLLRKITAKLGLQFPASTRVADIFDLIQQVDGKTIVFEAADELTTNGFFDLVKKSKKHRRRVKLEAVEEQDVINLEDSDETVPERTGLLQAAMN